MAILVLFYNKLEQTIDCISSFLPSGETIYVLNNGSPAVDFIQLQQRFKNRTKVIFFDAGRNLGPAGGRNYLISHTHEPWLVCIDNDITIKPEKDWKVLLQKFIDTHPQCEIVCPRIYNVHENAFIEQLMLEVHDGKMEMRDGKFVSTNFFPEGGVILRRTVFEKYGLYDEGMFAFEGYEFALRAKLSLHGELKVYPVYDIQLIHHHRFQKLKNDKEAVRQRYNEKKLRASYDRMIAKYNIKFNHDWQWWTTKQVNDMTGKRWTNTVKSIIKKLSGR